MHKEIISLKQLTKVEGSAGLDVHLMNGCVTDVQFKITEFKRFYTRAMKGKPIAAIPQLLARICGTCSNAHLMCAIECAENTLKITPTPQTMFLRELIMHGLMIRDHALHLYLFVSPDLFNKDSFLSFDENKKDEHQILHDAFELKAAGNFLSIITGGRSVHAPYPSIGGFTHFPEKKDIDEAIEKLQAARPAALRTISLFQNDPRVLDRKTEYMALSGERFNYLKGQICTSRKECIPEQNFRAHLERVVLPYTQATAYRQHGTAYMVGSLARLNVSKEALHKNTQKDAAPTLALFPSTNIYHNNLAQAIEILHSIDMAAEILQTQTFAPEQIIKVAPKAGEGVGVIEAPRGTLYHKMAINDKGIITGGDIVVPTGQNQFNIEKDVKRLVQDMLHNTTRETIVHEIEKLIRAYDPCMSCAAHFLKVEWKES